MGYISTAWKIRAASTLTIASFMSPSLQAQLAEPPTSDETAPPRIQITPERRDIISRFNAIKNSTLNDQLTVTWRLLSTFPTLPVSGSDPEKLIKSDDANERVLFWQCATALKLANPEALATNDLHQVEDYLRRVEFANRMIGEANRACGFQDLLDNIELSPAAKREFNLQSVSLTPTRNNAPATLAPTAAITDEEATAKPARMVAAHFVRA